MGRARNTRVLLKRVRGWLTCQSREASLLKQPSMLLALADAASGKRVQEMLLSWRELQRKGTTTEERLAEHTQRRSLSSVEMKHLKSCSTLSIS